MASRGFGNRVCGGRKHRTRERGATLFLGVALACGGCAGAAGVRGTTAGAVRAAEVEDPGVREGEWEALDDCAIQCVLHPAPGGPEETLVR